MCSFFLVPYIYKLLLSFNYFCLSVALCSRVCLPAGSEDLSKVQQAQTTYFVPELNKSVTLFAFADEHPITPESSAANSTEFN